MVDGRAPGMYFECGGLDERGKTVEILDFQQLGALLVLGIGNLDDMGVDAFPGMFLEEARPFYAVGTTQKRQRSIDDERRHSRPGQSVIIEQILFADAVAGPVDPLGMCQLNGGDGPVLNGRLCHSHALHLPAARKLRRTQTSIARRRKSIVASGLRHQLAAIDFDHLARDIAGQCRGCQEQIGADTILRRADEAHRDGLALQLHLFVIGVAFVERRCDDAGRNRIDADLVVDEFLGVTMRDGRDEALGGGIEDRAVAAAVAGGNRRGVDDEAALLLEVRVGGPGCGKHRAGVEVHHALIVLVGHFGGRKPAEHATGIVHQPVQATQDFGGFAHDPFGLTVLGDIALDQMYRAAAIPDL
ncbi:hypothetical protein RHSP_23570 [Rhizobium freirei PRF 81]|uniref:Uncharacterized protein n=1 Tax=Rhizobium freirei PRF 81 TaxID=363754 RepID=N6U898_9HYPH|nr:hypothetical protein RHSP_23570 [Rhizobium freirei PRF 81]